MRPISFPASNTRTRDRQAGFAASPRVAAGLLAVLLMSSSWPFVRAAESVRVRPQGAFVELTWTNRNWHLEEAGDLSGEWTQVLGATSPHLAARTTAHRFYRLRQPDAPLYQVSLRTFNGSYLVAEGGGSGPVLANRTAIGAWETFRLFNRSRPDSEPAHGDSIALQAWNGRWLSAAGGGGGAVNAELGWLEASTTFVLERIAGPGGVRSGDAIALRAASGQYVVAEGGGGGAVNADRAVRDTWETFTLQMFRPQLIRLRSAAGRYVTAEGGGGGEVTVNRPSVGLWETFAVMNLTRSDRNIVVGDLIALRAWNGNLVQSTAPSAVDARANQAREEGIFRVGSSLGGVVPHGGTLHLRLESTGRYLAVDAERLVADRFFAGTSSLFTLELAERAPIAFGWVPDGTGLTGRPFETLPPVVTGNRSLLTLYYHNNESPPITASGAQVTDAIFGRPPSLASWLQSMSAGAFRVRNAGVHGSLRIPDATATVPDPGIGAILTAAEDAGVPLGSFAPGGVFDTERTQLVEMSAFGLGGQARRWRSGTSRGGIQFAGSVPWVGVTPDVNEASRMVLCHELSHQLLDVRDRYGERRPLRGDVIANRTWVGAWEMFVVERLDGPGPVGTGDRILLRAHDGRHVAVDPNAPYFVNTEGPEAGDARLFNIVTLGSTQLTAGGRAAFLSNRGRYVTAIDAGDNSVIADAPWIREWETFEIGKVAGAAGNGIVSGDTISLRTLGGFYVVAETGARDRPRDPVTDANDRQRGYIWSGGVGQGGDFDNASANYSAVMLALWDRLRLGWVRPRFLTPDNRGSYILRPFLDSREALILFDPQNPTEWYTIENRQRREDVDEVPSSGLVISWINEDEGYWRWWFNRANDPDVGNYRALYPAVISAAAPGVPPNAMARPVVFTPDRLTRRNDSGAAFTHQELVLPLGNGDPSRFHLSFRPLSDGRVAISIR